jgi:hypothetical protein
MNRNLICSRIAAGLLLFAAQPALRAAETNRPPSYSSAISNSVATNKPTAAERRARIEAWRAERGGSNRPVIAVPIENTRQLPPPERRARLRAQMAELHEKKMSGGLTVQEEKQLRDLESHQRPGPAPTNPPPTNAVSPK